MQDPNGIGTRSLEHGGRKTAHLICLSLQGVEQVLEANVPECVGEIKIAKRTLT